MNRLMAAVLAVIAGIFFSQVSGLDQASAAESEQAAELEGIVVVAPRIVHHADRLREVTTVEKDAMVNFADLDIRQTTHFVRLERRIHNAASRICEELEEEFPRGRPNRETCIDRAVADAMDEVRSILREMDGN